MRALEEALAAEGRRVLSDWRAVVMLRRATRDTPPEERRWQVMPSSVYDVRPALQRLAAQGQLAQLRSFPSLYEVTSPFARKGAIDEEEILMELHPYATIGYISALVFHGMTSEFPNEIHALTVYDKDILPLGTRREDWEGDNWEGLAIVGGSACNRIMDRTVHWHRLSIGTTMLGIDEYRPHTYPARVTTPERTLIDGLQHPEWSGGIENVLRAWSIARDTVNVSKIVDIVHMYDAAILRQRVGFILDELGLKHSALEEWPNQAKRGGSSKLCGSAPFASTFSERWKLSINVPIDVLHGGEY